MSVGETYIGIDGKLKPEFQARLNDALETLPAEEKPNDPAKLCALITMAIRPIHVSGAADIVGQENLEAFRAQQEKLGLSLLRLSEAAKHTLTAASPPPSAQGAEVDSAADPWHENIDVLKAAIHLMLGANASVADVETILEAVSKIADLRPQTKEKASRGRKAAEGIVDRIVRAVVVYRNSVGLPVTYDLSTVDPTRSNKRGGLKEKRDNLSYVNMSLTADMCASVMTVLGLSPEYSIIRTKLFNYRKFLISNDLEPSADHVNTHFTLGEMRVLKGYLEPPIS